MLTKFGQRRVARCPAPWRPASRASDTGSGRPASSRCACRKVARPWSPSLVVMRADDGHACRMNLASLRQVLADLDARGTGVDFLERAAVGVAGLEIEGVHLAGAAVHPQQDAGLAPLRIRGGVVGQGFEPAGHRAADDAGRRRASASRGATEEVGLRIVDFGLKKTCDRCLRTADAASQSAV